MHSHNLGPHGHDHHFLGHAHGSHERSMRLVVALSLVMMAVEVAAGLIFGSMALLADGLHMAIHAGALSIAAAAYAFARRHRDDPRFSFGTGKVGDLTAFASAIVLAATALSIAGKSLHRLNGFRDIHYGEAIMVAGIGLFVNLVGAWLLHDNQDHGAHSAHGAGHHDHNHRAVYLQIVADALTSVLAIVGLLVAGRYGWNRVDPAVGLFGALIIGRWSWHLMTQTAVVKVDATQDLRSNPAFGRRWTIPKPVSPTCTSGASARGILARSFRLRREVPSLRRPTRRGSRLCPVFAI